jgi:four helix bundle protein
MKSVEDLDVFKLAHQLALKIYSVTKTFPREETFSLVDQMRRAAGSVGMNLMEGAMRLGSREYRRFVGIARGSAGEVCYQLLLAKDLKYITETSTGELPSGYDRVIQMLSRLSHSLNRWVEHEHDHDILSVTITFSWPMRIIKTCEFPRRTLRHSQHRGITVQEITPKRILSIMNAVFQPGWPDASFRIYCSGQRASYNFRHRSFHGQQPSGCT